MTGKKPDVFLADVAQSRPRAGRTLTLQEWEAEGTRRFGPDKMDWKAVLEALEKDGYQYRLGLETHGDAAKRMDNAHASMDEMMHIVGRLD